MLKIERINDVTVVSFKGVNRFNALITEQVKEEMKALFSSPNTKLVLDLSGVQFIDSSGFGVFLSIMKTANNNYGYFKISNISEEVMELFKLLQLHNVFEIYNKRDDALKSFN
ncbi:MAG: STAS domain-containing protein [Bacteroidales bacterium]|nr:STAS domain-containing protein [Bacteroidales bacterium]MCB8999998.1 STAS domain-containing protein [Bacteroidales bacterium]MCB9013273.1 STAS domain-containing protein [Bacteroidales bacterium]